MVSMSSRPTGYRRSVCGTIVTTVGRPCGSRAVETTPAGLLSAYTTALVRRGHRPAVDRDRILGLHVAGRDRSPGAADGDPAGADDLLGGAPRGDAGGGEVLGESHEWICRRRLTAAP